MNKYTELEAKESCLNYFEGDTLAADVFIGKYALRDKEGNLLEASPNQMHRRLAREFARIEANYPSPLFEEEIYEALKGFAKIVPQGSPMSGIGNNFSIQSLSNCVVVASPEDNMSSIFNTGKDIANLSKRRAGCGVDISTLRPSGSPVNNAARTSTGACSFADFFSYVVRMVGQNSRRGALICTIACNHYDIFEFIKMKHDLKKVTGANISIKLTNEFMDAVINDLDFQLQWPVEGEPKISKIVKAKDIWKEIVFSATKTAEPGVLFWDTICENLPAHEYPRFRTITTNPCCFSVKQNIMVQTRRGLIEIKQVTSDDLVWLPIEKVYAKTSGYFDAGTAKVYKLVLDCAPANTFYVTENHKFMNRNHELIKVSDMMYVDERKNIKVKYDSHVIEDTYPFKEIKVYSIKEIGYEKVGCIEVENFHYFSANGVLSGNSEIPLSAYDSCRLLSLNLKGFVENHFEANAKFDHVLFEKHIRIAVRLLDDLIDLELEMIDKILSAADTEDERALWNKMKETCKTGRRIGLGTHGLADMFATLRIKYDSDAAIEMANKVYQMLRNVAYDESINLAKERGPFEDFDYNLEKENKFIKRLPEELRKKLSQFGRRNISLLTNAPTGSVSIVSKTNSGIEPFFRIKYSRKRKLTENNILEHVDFVDEMGDKWQNYDVFVPTAKEYISKFVAPLPDFFVEADKIDWRFRVKLQGTIQKYIDHSISSTISLPCGTKEEVVSEIYMMAHREGLKGCTVYVDGTRDGVLTEQSSGKKKINDEFVIDAPKRPKELPCNIFNVKIDNEPWIILIGTFNDRPFEVFGGRASTIQIPKKIKSGVIEKMKEKNGINGRYTLKIGEGEEQLIIKDIIKVFDNPNQSGMTRLISLSLRHGVNVKYLVEQLTRDKESDMFSFNKVVARCLKNFIIDGERSSNNCPECTSKLIYRDGCVQCEKCTWSKC